MRVGAIIGWWHEWKVLRKQQGILELDIGTLEFAQTESVKNRL